MISQPFMADSIMHGYRTLFEHLPTPYLILAPNEPEYTILYTNPAFQHIAQQPGETLQGKSVFEIISDNHADWQLDRISGLYDSLRKVTTSKKPDKLVNLKYQIGTHKMYSREDRWWTLLQVPVLGNSGNVELIIQSVVSTTFQQLQRENEAMIEELRRSNSDLEQFAYIASHDLQEPLRKITAFGDILKNRFGDTLGSEGSNLIDRMQLASERMRRLMDDLLIYSRVSAHTKRFRPVDLNRVVREVLIDIENTIREKKAIVNVPELPQVTGDEVQLRQLFLNLLSNALKFQREGVVPEVSISTQLFPEKDMHRDGMLSADAPYYVQICIEDNGIGFEQEYAERIFQIFQRLHGRMEYPGTGVGLSIVRKVVEQHKGFITATGRPGEGASFCLYIPAA